MGRHRAEEVPGREGLHIPAVRPEDSHPTRRRGPQHARAEVVRGEPRAVAKRAPAKAAPAKRAPAKAAPAKAAKAAAPRSAPPARAGGGSNPTGKAIAASTVAGAVNSGGGGGKPSVVGRAAGGAATGAAAGAAVGSVVPGVGTAIGAGVGAAIGGVGGGVSGSRAKAAYKADQRRAAGTAGPRRLVVAEFAICMIVVSLSPLTDEMKNETPQRMMKRLTAVMALFFVLGILSSFGRGAARAAAGFGGIVAVALAVSERDLFAKVAKIFDTNSSGKTAVKSTGPPIGVDVASMSGKRERPLPGRRTGRES